MKKLLLILLLASSAALPAQDVPVSKLSPDDKTYGLSKVWKEADKNFVFFDQVPHLNWDSTYQRFIPIVRATKSDYEYFRELQRFCSLLNDGHTRVYVPWELRRVMEASPAIRTELIGDRVVIVEILNDTVMAQGIREGMEITEIDGEEVHQYAKEKVIPFVFYSTDQDKKVQAYEYNLLKGPIDNLLHIKVKEDGKIREFQLSRKLTKKKVEKGIFEFSVLPGNTGHLRIYRFWGDDFEQEFDSVFQLVKKTDRLIIDVSLNQGGNSGFADYVLKHFVDKPYRTSNWKTPKYMPAYASWGRELEWVDNKGYKVKPAASAKRYHNKVVVLMTEKTYSAGEDFVSAFLNTGRGKAIGRTTAGTTGNPIGFQLFDGGFQICSKRDYLADGTEFVGYGIKPQIVVEKSMNEEKLMAKALEILK